MDLLIALLRWLLGIFSRGVWAAWAEQVPVLAWASYGPIRGGDHRERPRAGRKRVGFVVEQSDGPPGRQTLSIPIACHRGRAGRVCPVRPDHVLRGRMPAHCSNTDPSKPARPVWG
jgi:hypothetical protein